MRELGEYAMLAVVAAQAEAHRNDRSREGPAARRIKHGGKPAYALAASSACCSRDFGCTPTNLSTTSPFLKTISVGMLLTP